MTLTVSPWAVWAVLSLALFGLVFWWRVARAAAGDARAWLRDRTPLWGAWLRWAVMTAWCRVRRQVPPPWLPPEGDPLDPLPEEWDHDELELPPERTWEQMTSHQFPLTDPPGWQRLGDATITWMPPPGTHLSAMRERRAPWWEAEARQAYAALELDYPSGLLARVREAAP